MFSVFALGFNFGEIKCTYDYNTTLIGNLSEFFFSIFEYGANEKFMTLTPQYVLEHEAPSMF